MGAKQRCATTATGTLWFHNVIIAGVRIARSDCVGPKPWGIHATA